MLDALVVKYDADATAALMSGLSSIGLTIRGGPARRDRTP
jgi:hypothetical protein